MWRGIAGGIMGGMLGSMLFRGLGYGSDLTGEGGGIGLFEILLIGALLYCVYWYFKRRRQVALARAYQESSMEMAPQAYGMSPSPSQGQPAEEDKARGISHIRQMDPSFDEKQFLDLCMDKFFQIQGAWANRDMTTVRKLMTDEMFRTLQADAASLKSEGKINRLDNIAVRSVDLVEIWQESGNDYTTVKYLASLLDYTIDETRNEVVSGSRTEPVKFEEYWTFTRPVGNRPWQLSAINQAE
jgi:predicted lipid-binding transport protein (Tim44 family)